MELLAFFENRPIFPITNIRESNDVVSFRSSHRSTFNDYIKFIETTLMSYQRRWAKLVSGLPNRSLLMWERAIQLRRFPSPHAPNLSNQELFRRDDAFDDLIIAYIFCSKTNAKTYFKNRCIGGLSQLIIATNLRPDQFWSSKEEVLEIHNKVFPRNYSNLKEFECYVAICISDAFEECVHTASTARFWKRCESERIAYDLLMIGARRLHDANERGIKRKILEEVVDKHIVAA